MSTSRFLVSASTNGASERVVPRREQLRRRLRAYRQARDGSERPSPRVAVPSFFTLLNLLCGFLALTQVHEGAYALGGGFIVLAALFDVFDGFMARLTGAQSPFGVQLDSLSDVISFGVAPGYLAYAYGLHELGVLGMIVAALPAICGAVRLARYNVSSDGTGKSEAFSGLPIPAQAIIIVALILNVGEIEWFTQYTVADPTVLAAIVVGLAVLMVSNIRFDAPPMPTVEYVRAHPRKTIAYAIGFVLLLVFQQVGLLVALSAYLLHGMGQSAYRLGTALLTPVSDDRSPPDNVPKGAAN